MIITYKCKRVVRAWCETCGKSWEALNAQVVGKRHAEKYQHIVKVDVYQAYTYEPE